MLIVGVFLFVSYTQRKKEAEIFESPSSLVYATTTAEINFKTSTLQIADTTQKKELGLGGRTTLGERQGMLFVFTTLGRYAFWMKDMKIPIDIIWLDEHFDVVDFVSNVSPETYPKTSFSPRENALYVLETHALFSEKNNLKIKDHFEINLNK